MGLTVRDGPNAYTVKPKRQRPYFTSGWDHVCDHLDPNAVPANALNYAKNLYPVKGGASGWEQRPGFSFPLGVLPAKVQGFIQFTKLDGTELSVIVSNGVIHTVNWTTLAVTEVVSTANLTTAGITLSTTLDQVWLHVFNNKLIIGDNSNVRFSWDGTSGAGGLTKLTNMPVILGPLTVYYAKLFGIKASDPRTIVWSEENAENTGYEAGGYNNAWTLGQTDQEALWRLWGTNTHLVYWRETSIGAISGAVTTDFRNSGTHDWVSTTVGTKDIMSVCQAGEWFYFIDANYRPQRMSLSAGVQGEAEGTEPIWKDCDYTTRLIQRSANGAFAGAGIYDIRTGMVVLFVKYSLGTIAVANDDWELNTALIFNATSGKFCGIWEFATKVRQLGLLYDSFYKKYRLCHATNVDTAATTLAVHGSTGGPDFKWGDDAIAINCAAATGFLGFEGKLDKDWDRMTWGVRLPAIAVSVSIAVRTNETITTFSPSPLNFTAPGLHPPPADRLGYLETQVVRGLSFQARWLQSKFEFDATSNFVFPGGISWAEATAYGGSDAPTAK